jgi:hypothetical protein
MNNLQEVVELLGQIEDTACEYKLLFRGQSSFVCRFCGSIGFTPPKVIHKPTCMFLKVKDMINLLTK